MDFPPIPKELRNAFALYLEEFKNNLERFAEKNSEQSFSFTDEEKLEFRQRFHRLKGSSGFFNFNLIASLAQDGQSLFEQQPFTKEICLGPYQNICQSLSSFFGTVKDY